MLVKVLDKLLRTSTILQKLSFQYVLEQLRKDPKELQSFISHFRPQLIEIAENYPSIVNNGYRHIDKIIELIHYFKLDLSNAIIDVGGASGEMSILFSKAFPNATIYAFEPIKNTFENAKQNIKDYPNIKLKNVALGSVAKKMNIQLAERIDSSSLFMINEQIDDEYLAKNIKKKGEEEIEIQVLDDLGLQDNYYNLIKLDVQGYELEVLKGATQTLRKTKFVLLELQNHDSYINAPRYHQLDEFLRNQNFELFDMIPSIRKAKQIYELDGIYINKNL